MTNRDPQHSNGVASRRRTRSMTGAMTLVLLCAGTVPAFGATVDTTAPAAVRGMATSADKSRVKLDWTNSTEKDLAGYLVYRSTAADGVYTKLTATPRTGSDYSDTAAPIGVRSYYRVTAIDRSGNESAPVAVSNVRQDGVAPAAPATVTGIRTESGISLDWADNAESDLAGYLVTRATSSGGTYTKLTSAPIAGSSFVDTTAVTGVSYYYRVTAVDHGGFASKVSSVAVLIPDTIAPASVTAMKISASTSSVKLDWASGRESDLAGYHVYRATTVDGTYTKLTTAPRTASDYTDATGPAGVPSYYRVVAVDKAGNESVAAAVTAVRKDATAPTAPKLLSAVGSDAGITLSWAANSEADLVGYVVARATTSGGTYTVLTPTPLTTPQYVDTTAVPGTTYFYRLTARDLSGNTSSNATASTAIPDTTAPGVVDGVTAVAGDASVTVTWNAVTAADLAGYRVLRSTDGKTFAAVSSGTLTATSFTDRSARNGTAYQYAVVALDKATNVSEQSVSAAATPSDVTAPAAPGTLVATGTADGVTLTWTKNTEVDLAGYVVKRSDSAGGEFVALTTAPQVAAEYTDTTAPQGLRSYYRVVAVDTAGNESPVSVTADAEPLDVTAPAQPAGLIATGSLADIALDWADNTETDTAGYLVYRSTTVDGTYAPLTDAPITASEFTDTTAPAGATSYYRVTAVDTSTNASPAAGANGVRTVEKSAVAGADVTVAQDGSGDHTTIGAALKAAPAGTAPFVIGIKAGTYREVLTVDRANVTLLGGSTVASDVVIAYDNAAGTPKPGGGTYGTTGSATVLIKANGVTTKNLTIENSYVETGVGSEQAVALKTVGDRLVFDNVRLLGDQDTLYADSAGAGVLARSYYVNSYIEGDVDFIFGRGTAVFDRSTIKAATRGSTSNNGYVTAASTDKSLTYGYLITDSTIESDAPANTFSLGRPWQPSNDVNAIAQVVIRDTVLPAAIKATAWSDMGASLWKNARLFEYGNTGPGAGVTADRPQLTAVEAAKYTKFTYLAGSDGWNPTGQTPPPPPADTTAPAAPAGVSAEAADSKVTLAWTANGESDVAGYNVYRSSTGTVELKAANLLASALTTTEYIDRTAANGTSYTYAVTAVDRAGNESPTSTVTGAPVGVPLPAHDILVAADGTGQYTSVQAAITAAVAGTAAKPTVIAVKPGIYKEMITVSKNYTRIIGTTGNAKDVVLTFDNAANTINPATGTAYGTGGSQSVLVRGNNVTVKDLTIENSFKETGANGEQAVALKTTGDRLVFDNVRLLGNQDTLLVDSGDAPVVTRSYFVNSYIEGDVDFIFGRGTAVFDRTTIHALSRGSNSNNGYITAASTSDKNPNGFLIINSTVTSNAPAGTYSLGRPWRGWTDGYTKNGVVYNSRGQVTIRNTALPPAIRTAQPWADMSPNLWTDGRFFEYQNTGAGATVNANRPQLTDEQAAGATPQAFLAGTDAWNPVG